VTVGPGSYTGLRVGISAARAIGLAVNIPVVGVTTLSALMAPLVAAGANRLLVSAIDARHGHVYVQAVAPGGHILLAPTLLSIAEVVRVIGTANVTLVGSGASILASEAWNAGADARVHEAPPVPDIGWVARLGMAAEPDQALPKPLYLRGPDARPQDQARLPRA
jgi:tRNA threonylcarbamoyl adenosine modification protein YeaZ